LGKVQHWFFRTLCPVRPRSLAATKRPLIPTSAPPTIRSLLLSAAGLRQTAKASFYRLLIDCRSIQRPMRIRHGEYYWPAISSQSSPSREHGFSAFRCEFATVTEWRHPFKLPVGRDAEPGASPSPGLRGIAFRGELTDRGCSVKEREHVNRAIRVSTYPLGTLTGADNSAVPGSGAFFRAR
jgi:hypothetical protein